MSQPFYDYETIAGWWYQEQVTEAKVKRLYPGIDTQRLKRMAMYWSKQYESSFDWNGYDVPYSSPIELAFWMLNEENDSPVCVWFRGNLRSHKIKNETYCDQILCLSVDDDAETLERFEIMSDEWGGCPGFWLSQVAFYAVRIQDGRGWNDYLDDNRKAA